MWEKARVTSGKRRRASTPSSPASTSEPRGEDAADLRAASALTASHEDIRVSDPVPPASRSCPPVSSTLCPQPGQPTRTGEASVGLMALPSPRTGAPGAAVRTATESKLLSHHRSW